MGIRNSWIGATFMGLATAFQSMRKRPTKAERKVMREQELGRRKQREKRRRYGLLACGYRHNAPGTKLAKRVAKGKIGISPRGY